MRTSDNARHSTLIAARLKRRYNGWTRQRRWLRSNGSAAFEPHLLRGGALIAQGASAGAVTYLRKGHEARPVNRSRPFGFALLAAVLLQQGEHAVALAMVRDGLKVQEETGHGLWNAELHRFEGIVLFGSTGPSLTYVRLRRTPSSPQCALAEKSVPVLDWRRLIN